MRIWLYVYRNRLGGVYAFETEYLSVMYVSVDCDCVCLMRCLCLVSFGGYIDTWSVVDGVWDDKSM